MLILYAGSTAFYSSPQNGSPMGSPYSYVGTETADSPLSYSGSSVGGYYQQSMSPDSVNIGSPFYQQVLPSKVLVVSKHNTISLVGM